MLTCLQMFNMENESRLCHESALEYARRCMVRGEEVVEAEENLKEMERDDYDWNDDEEEEEFEESFDSMNYDEENFFGE